MPVMTQDERIEETRRQNRRAHANDPAYLSRMREQIARCFGFRISADRLDEAERLELIELHEKATETEGWEAGIRHYGLTSRLSKNEQKRWRQLAGKAAGVDLDALDEDGKAAKRIRELAARAMRPEPSSMAAPPGSAVLPAEALDDLHGGRLALVDLAFLAEVALTFSTGKIHPRLERDAAWADEGTTLILRGSGLHRLLPAREDESYLDLAIEGERDKITRRLTSAGWLDIQKTGNELHIRLGARLAGQAAA